MKKPVVLVIMDGIGLANAGKGNAYSIANTPNLDKYFDSFPHTTLQASGEAVGLPKGQMGNSEVGHMNIGAGRVVYQSLTRLNKSVEEDKFLENEAYASGFNHAISNDSKLHIFGLLSDGGVHSHIEHIKAMIRTAKAAGVKKTFVHAFLDGRDVGPQSAVTYIEELEAFMEHIQYGKIATVSGRYYAMDRDKNWERTQKAYDAMSFGKAEYFDSAAQGVLTSYENGVNDEFVIPFVVDKEGMIKDNDSIIFMNFRPDRAIQIATAYSNPEEAPNLNTENGPKNVGFVSTMKYADSVKGEIAFGLNDLTDMFGDYIADQGLNQLRIAETEKYAHVTFFFDGGVDKEIKNAKRVLIPSPKVPTYDLKPEMSAYEITDNVLRELDSKIHDVVILNFANGDMVGHTGVIEAAVKAVEAVDECVGKVVDKVKEVGGIALLTADHGNCEKMLDDDGTVFTAHTTNLVPFIVTDPSVQLRSGGALGDIAPTMLKLLGLKQPKAMTGKSIIE
ncbi:2,3-bisphosphoglycerate-independent phosphoglycerate mutase [Hujiaoplasma nucleasis]|uniref:2,3-bisphosphoglycerate-independent phosphoglycerate mutase n=1 Tax=Hujiaoplasma nucleasis TaxID=2725268 RepID=A0A7L6N183_9MOLU|nr:2,3-bisphosphoglycerate-independent phosphoglycerate mutase [Hujiaoplasma nucleasis]QLY40016.1 2,3-bisphosphoglycerate-independent phosphoglycerate mutase [Hujiaoplasma nucleasis]